MIKDFQRLKNELSNLGGGGGFQLPSLPLLGLPGRNPRDLDLDQECLEVEVVS